MTDTKRARGAVEKWNQQHPIGTPVTVRMDSGELRETATRSMAQMLGQSAVIWVDGIAGCYALERVAVRKAVPA